MNMNLVNEITASQIRTDLPSFSSGDTIKVHVRITEGDTADLSSETDSVSTETTILEMETEYPGRLVKT